MPVQAVTQRLAWPSSTQPLPVDAFRVDDARRPLNSATWPAEKAIIAATLNPNRTNLND
jgi:hypothetical protein